MEVIKGTKKVNFDLDIVAGMEYKDFEASCLRLQPFKDMEPKERKKKIKEVWSYASKRKAKANKADKSGKHIPGNNQGERGDTSEDEQKPAPGWTDQSKPEDNAEI